MKKELLIMILIFTPIIFSGCSQLDGTKVFNWFTYKDTLDFATNCSVNYNISLSNSYCNGTMKRPIYYSFDTVNNTWDNVCCTFDSRCLAKINANVSKICNDFNASFTYISPIYTDSGSGSLCCNGAGQCIVDHLPLSNCTTMVNTTAEVTTIAFNLTGTDEWNSICCISGGY